MNRCRQSKGQGLIELVVSIGIIAASIVTILGLVIATTAASNASKTQVLAINLAREGIEVVRGQRDTNWLARDGGSPSTQWNDSLYDMDGGGYDFTAIAQFQPPGAGSGGTWFSDFSRIDTIDDDGAIIYLHPVTGVYSQISNLGQLDCAASGIFCDFQPTQFRRLITVSPICWPTVGPPGEEIMGAFSVQTCDEVYGSGLNDYDQVGVQIRSRVQWMERGKTRSTELVEKIFNWKP